MLKSGVEFIAVLIPVWQPDHRLIPLVSSLLATGFPAILIIDDGSDSGSEHIFRQLQELPGVRVVTHAVNLGKGRALKTGINDFLVHFPQLSGVVTCDADGQHHPDDVFAIASVLAAGSRALVLGSRQFRGTVPARSRFGNTLSRYVFALLTGRLLRDTQSGLRGFPKAILPRVLRLEGERYEYEMNVLSDAAVTCGIAEVPIQTIYLEGNRSSHFNPVRDSMRIYFVLFRFYLSSLLSAAIDFVVFSLVYWYSGNLLASVIAGRVSSLFNFFLNRKFVFSSPGAFPSALAKYYLLVLALASVSYSGIWVLSTVLRLNVPAAKLLVETLLSVASFSIQRTFVFRSKEKV